MSSFTVMDRNSQLVVEHGAGGALILQVRDEAGRIARLPLTTLMLSQLGYHACLWYRERTGRQTLTPAGFTNPAPSAVAPSSPRLRTRA